MVKELKNTIDKPFNFCGEMEALETTVQIFPFKIVLLVCLLACFSFRDNSEGTEAKVQLWLFFHALTPAL